MSEKNQYDPVRWAEGLILQLPKDHDGRNSWLLNYGSNAVALQSDWEKKNPNTRLTLGTKTHPAITSNTLPKALGLAEELSSSPTQSSTTCAIAAELRRLHEVELERDRLHAANAELVAALKELVSVKDLEERTDALHFAGPLSSSGENWEKEFNAGRKEYIRRQPVAWEAARAAIAKHEGQS